jgi:hypothetical protein
MAIPRYPSNPVSGGDRWATISGGINTETWSSRVGDGRRLTSPCKKKFVVNLLRGFVVTDHFEMDGGES